MIKWLKKKFTRQSETPVNEDRSFVPLGSGGAQYGSVYSPQLARCVSLYVDALINTPIKCSDENDHFYKSLIQRRLCPFLSNYNFYELLVLNLKLWGNFFAVIQTNEKGQVQSLLPYASPQAVTTYPALWRKKKQGEPTGDWGDPIKIARDGWYYRDYRARMFSQDEMFHIKHSAYNTSTGLLEGTEWATKVFNRTFTALSKMQAVLDNICSRDLRSPLILSGLGYSENSEVKTSASETKKVKEALRTYFNGESQTGSSGVLALPSGYSISPLRTDDTSKVLMSINDVISSNLASIFGIPRSLLFTSENTERDSKEAKRQWYSSGFKAMTRIIEDEFNRLSGYRVEYKFDLDSLRYLSADIREEMAISQLQNILTPQEIKEKIDKY